MFDYIPTEQDIIDFNSYVSTLEKKSEVVLVRFANQPSKEYSYTDVRNMLMLMWYKYVSNNPDVTRKQIQLFFESHIKNFKSVYCTIMDIRETDYNDLFDEKPYPYLKSLWMQLFDKYKIATFIAEKEYANKVAKRRVFDDINTPYDGNVYKFIYRIKKFYPSGLSLFELKKEAISNTVSIWLKICKLCGIMHLADINSPDEYQLTRDEINTIMTTLDLYITDESVA